MVLLQNLSIGARLIGGCSLISAHRAIPYLCYNPSCETLKKKQLQTFNKLTK
jgi:hypothetical protein